MSRKFIYHLTELIKVKPQIIIKDITFVFIFIQKIVTGGLQLDLFKKLYELEAVIQMLS